MTATQLYLQSDFTYPCQPTNGRGDWIPAYAGMTVAGYLAFSRGLGWFGCGWGNGEVGLWRSAYTPPSGYRSRIGVRGKLYAGMTVVRGDAPSPV